MAVLDFTASVGVYSSSYSCGTTYISRTPRQLCVRIREHNPIPHATGQWFRIQRILIIGSVTQVVRAGYEIRSQQSKPQLRFPAKKQAWDGTAIDLKWVHLIWVCYSWILPLLLLSFFRLATLSPHVRITYFELILWLRTTSTHILPTSNFSICSVTLHTISILPL